LHSSSVIAELENRALLFEPCDLGDIRVEILEVREIAASYEPDIFPDFLRVKDKKHVAGLEVAQL
jgi:hypothetical protein